MRPPSAPFSKPVSPWAKEGNPLIRIHCLFAPAILRSEVKGIPLSGSPGHSPAEERTPLLVFGPLLPSQESLLKKALEAFSPRKPILAAVPQGDGTRKLYLSLALPEVRVLQKVLLDLEKGEGSLAEILDNGLRGFLKERFALTGPGFVLPLGGKPLVMGILNVTPDSFSNGGDFFSVDAAVSRGKFLAEEGAHILDIGGESTRPGSSGISLEEESRRVLPVIERLAKEVRIPISIDTSKAKIAEKALDAGAGIINDVTACRGDLRMAEVVASRGVPVILMHMLGSPRNMQERPFYRDVLFDVMAFLRERIDFLTARGVKEEQVVVDPGIGFGKTFQHNLAILRGLEGLRTLGRPVLLGHSRKSFLEEILRVPPKERIFGGAAVSALAALQGIHILRVHDVRETLHAVSVAASLAGSPSGESIS